MKTTITSLIMGITLSALAPTAWAAGRGGGGGGGFHGGGFGGGGFHGGGGFRGGGFGGGRAFGSGAPAFGSPGFRAAGRSGRTRSGTNVPYMSRIAPQRKGIASTARPATPRVASSQNTTALTARPQGGAGLNGLNGRTDHIAERHNATWNRDWDRGHPHFRNGRFFVFDNGFWWGLDAGYYPWDYYPYYDYDYYPYDYYVGDPDNVPANYQGATTSQPAPDATVENVQTQLAQQGYFSGSIDGLFGPTTRDALVRYQTSKNLSVTGSLSPETLESFGLPPQVVTN